MQFNQNEVYIIREGPPEHPIYTRGKWIRKADAERFHVVVTKEIVPRQLRVHDHQIIHDDGRKLK